MYDETIINNGFLVIISAHPISRYRNLLPSVQHVYKVLRVSRQIPLFVIVNLKSTVFSIYLLFFQIDFYFDYQGDFPGFDTWKIALVMIVFVDVHRSVTILNTICQTSETIKIYI